MKLKLRQLEFDAGRPVAFITHDTAYALDVHVGDRIEVSYGEKKDIAIIDIVQGLLDKDEIALSAEITSDLSVNPGRFVEVRQTNSPKSLKYILKKLNGYALSRSEIYTIIQDIVNNALTESEIAYFVAGVYERGMSFQETINLTEAMYKTGNVLSWGPGQKITDKHSIGGIPGNRTTPIVVAICASLGVIMPKTSSRSITSAAGTADVVETIANIELSPSELKRIVNKTGACLAWGGSLGLAPADDKLIRVERLLNIDPESQLLSSILAKKLAVGSHNVLIDIPYGKGAKVNFAEAKKLKEKFLSIGNAFNLKMKVVLTDGSQPIGNGIGSILEINDVLHVLNRDEKRPRDLEEKSLFLAGQILELAGKAEQGEGMQLAKQELESKRALSKFNEIISAQGRKKISLEPGKYKYELKSERSGTVRFINNKTTNLMGKALGCPADKRAGIYLYKHAGDSVQKGETIAVLYAESPEKLKDGINFFDSYHPIHIS
jgi:putative thymidine phosphorylase